MGSTDPGSSPDPMPHRGTHRVYLGAAPGVGKTYAMLAEAHRRRDRGTDVVVGAAHTHGRAGTRRLLEGLERVPDPQAGAAPDTWELDLGAVLARRPAVVLVDELARPNPPGSRHARRWQDVEDLLAAGIDVISTLDVSQLASLTDTVEAITGVRPVHTVPDAAVRHADQIELVDMTPQALQRRIAHGNVLPGQDPEADSGQLFGTASLTALRELALLWLADRVDDALQGYRSDHGIDVAWPARERVVVGVAGGPGDQMLLRRAARIAGRIAGHGAGGELLAVHVSRPGTPTDTWPPALAADRELVTGLGGTFHGVVGDDPAQALLDFALGARASQIVVGAPPRRRRPWHRFREGVAEAISRSGAVDVHLVGLGSDPSPGMADQGRARRGPRSLGRRRAVGGWALAVAGPPLLVLAMLPGRDRLSLSTHAMVFLLLTVGVALLGGLWPALAAAAAGGLLLNWYFTPPFGGLTISDPQNAFTLLAIVLVGVAVSSVVDLADRRRVQAGRSAREAETLGLLARGTMLQDGAEPVLARLGQTLRMTSVCLLERSSDQGAWRPVAAWGGAEPASPAEADESVSLTPDLVLALRGRRLPADDRRVLEAFAAQAAVLLERRRLRRRAREAADLAHGNAVRTALLAAVSHDLRTPLASVKAAISSLRQPDVRFAPEDEAELLATVEAGTDRLEALIENLLDVTRLQTGAIRPLIRVVALDEVVPRALDGVPPELVRLEIDEALPMIRTDPGLLERILANLVQNAVTHAASPQPILVAAAVRSGQVAIRVVDRGPGVPDGQKGRIFAPFQRAGDAPSGSGVGLGLAVARGFAHALGGRLDAEDTPGGGLTMVLTLPTGQDADAGEVSAEPIRPGASDGTSDGTGAGQP